MSAAVTNAELAVDSRCQLGEGAVWDERTQALLWTDIQRARLWRYVPASGATHQWTLPDRLGSFALCESGRLLLGLAKGLYLADLTGDGGRLSATLLETVDEHPSLRINDGRVDRSGRFVFGTLDESAEQRPIGRFYQYSAREGLRTLDLGRAAIPNSLALSPDGDTLYYCDTLRGDIMRCDYDAASAGTSAAEVFVRVDAPAAPDGATVDRDGRLWSAQWGAGRVVCYANDGRIEHVLHVPATNTSCVAFGGPALDTLYVTSACDDLAAAELAREPHAGGVFRAKVAGAAGLPEPRLLGL